MKTLIYGIFFILIHHLAHAQPTYEMTDVTNGSSIRLIKICKNNKELYLKNWNKPNSNTDRMYHLKKLLKTDTIALDMFFVKYSEMDSTTIKHALIYKKDTMSFNIKKNLAHLRVEIKKVNFKKGVHFMDLKKLYQKHKTHEITLEEFPTPCGTQKTRNR